MAVRTTDAAGKPLEREADTETTDAGSNDAVIGNRHELRDVSLSLKDLS